MREEDLWLKKKKNLKLVKIGVYIIDHPFSCEFLKSYFMIEVKIITPLDVGIIVCRGNN